jgi:NAD(P)-dependent dehydrogenase (short-subunit alcohol dehydrogenase family)
MGTPTNRGTGLKGKTALITGAARRIGRATALALARAGVHVVVHYRSSKHEAEDTAEAARKCGVKAWAIPADLRIPAEARSLLPLSVERSGPIDVLVNNASLFTRSPLKEFDPEELSENIRIHAMAPLLLARALAAQGGSGAIVNLLDSRIRGYDTEHAAYYLGKRMLFDLTRMMALEFAPRIRVNAVAPGLILPPPGKDEAYLEHLAPKNPLHRIGTVEGVIDAILFLLRSDYVTGQVIFVDGGRHLKGDRYGRPGPG